MTERRLLQSATALIAARGTRSVSIADVGQQAGYSRGIVTHHFGSKPGLLEAVVLYAQYFEVPGAGTGSGLEQLSRIAETYLTNLREREPAGQAFLLMWTEAIGSDPLLAPLYAQRDAWFRGLLADTVRTGLHDHSIRAQADPASVAVLIAGLLRGVGLQLMSGTVDTTLDRIAEQTIALIQTGLAPPKFHESSAPPNVPETESHKASKLR